MGKVDLGASPGAEAWKDVLQLLKQQNEKVERLARALSKVITLSDYRCIEFNLEQRCQAVDKGRRREGRSPSWNTRRLSRERLREHLEETRLIDVLVERPVGGPTSRMPCSAAKIHPHKGQCYTRHGKGQKRL